MDTCQVSVKLKRDIFDQEEKSSNQAFACDLISPEKLYLFCNFL